jgi:hypothetical protein
MLLMAHQAVFPGLVKSDFCPHFTGLKFMALETLLIRDAFPRFVAGGTICDVFVKVTQRPWFGSRVIEKKPAGKGKHEEDTEYRIEPPHHSHLIP